MGIMALLGLAYLVSRFRKFHLIKQISTQHKWLSWLAAALPVAALSVFLLINVTTMIVVTIHLMIIWFICDLVSCIWQKIRRQSFKRYYAGASAILFTALYLGAGWYYAHHVYQTNYALTTSKDLGQENLRIAMIADAHLGITLDGEAFAKQMERINQTEPDIVVIAGDFVDDDTDRGNMIEACRALGELKTAYGVYFSYGNHDNGYYNYRDFTSQELREELTKNHVTILEDEAVLINDSFYLIGRKDRSMHQRTVAEELTSNLDSSKYMVLLDHQPNDYAREAAADVDIVLSGHTHGGHMFPAGYIGLAIGANDSVYGMKQINDTTFLVTSGISGWAIPFKTGTISEYVVIDISN